jgi:hypothetical protein
MVFSLSIIFCCHVINLSRDQKHPASIIRVNGLRMHIEEQKAVAEINRLMVDFMGSIDGKGRDIV